MLDYGESGAAHRTTYGHFLAKGKWEDKRLEETQKCESFHSHKRYMDLKSFMVRAAQALDRLPLVLALAHLPFPCALGHVVPFRAGLRLCRAAFVNSWICSLIVCAQPSGDGEQPGYPDSGSAAGDAVHPGERQGRADSDRGRDYDSEGAAPTPRTLEKRLTAFYGQPMEKTGYPEVDWGTAEGCEAW